MLADELRAAILVTLSLGSRRRYDEARAGHQLGRAVASPPTVDASSWRHFVALLGGEEATRKQQPPKPNVQAGTQAVALEQLPWRPREDSNL